VVSIPPVFVDEQGIKAGDVIKFYVEGEKLILIPEKKR
jgi:antitoxin component of MazEF toxin-antitoxin module